jgi:hypothetical protein
MIDGIDNTELARLLAAVSSSDDASLAVLGDWLQSQHHPWGDLIALQRGGAEREAAELLASQRDKLLEDLARDEGAHFEWRNGMWMSATVRCEPTPESVLARVRVILAHPMAHVLSRVVIDPMPTSFSTTRDWESSSKNIVDPWPKLPTLAKSLPPRVEHVGFGTASAPAAAYVAMPNWQSLSDTFSKLAGLELAGTWRNQTQPLELRELTHLTVKFAQATRQALEALAQSRLPKLVSLTVGLGGAARCTLDEVHPPAEWDEDNEDAERYPPTFSDCDLAALDVYEPRLSVTAADVTQLLNAPWPDTLRHLAIDTPRLDAALAAAIVGAPLIERLDSLAISGCELGEPAVRAFVTAKRRLAHLTHIDLTRTKLDRQLREGLAVTLPNVRVLSEPRGGELDSFVFRYVATME